FPAGAVAPPPAPFPDGAAPRGPSAAARVRAPVSPLPSATAGEAAPSRPEPAEPDPAALDQALQTGGPASLASSEDWHQWVLRSGLKGPARVLAEHAGFLGLSEGTLRLALAPEDELL